MQGPQLPTETMLVWGAVWAVTHPGHVLQWGTSSFFCWLISLLLSGQIVKLIILLSSRHEVLINPVSSLSSFLFLFCPVVPWPTVSFFFFHRHPLYTNVVEPFPKALMPADILTASKREHLGCATTLPVTVPPDFWIFFQDDGCTMMSQYGLRLNWCLVGNIRDAQNIARTNLQGMNIYKVSTQVTRNHPPKKVKYCQSPEVLLTCTPSPWVPSWSQNLRPLLQMITILNFCNSPSSFLWFSTCVCVPKL